MSRRVLTPRPQAIAKAGQRMAPGGRLWSESPIRPFYRPIGEAGEEYVEPEPTDPYLRPVAISGGVLVGGAGNTTLRDQSDTTYASLSRTPHSGQFVATFETRTLGFTPTAARLYVRTRTVSTFHTYFVWTLARSIPAGGVPATDKYCGFGTTDFTSVESGGGNPMNTAPGSGWYNTSAAWSDGFFGYSTPSAAEVAAGIQVFFDGATSVGYPEDAGADFRFDIADVWLELT